MDRQSNTQKIITDLEEENINLISKKPESLKICQDITQNLE